MSRKYSVIEIAQLLDVNIETVRRWIRKDELAAEQPSRKEGNVITGEALHRFLKSNAKYETRAIRNGYVRSSAVKIKIVENAQANYAAEILSAASGRKRTPGNQSLFSAIGASRKLPDSPKDQVIRTRNMEYMSPEARELIAIMNIQQEMMTTQQKEIDLLKRKLRSSNEKIRRSSIKKK